MNLPRVWWCGLLVAAAGFAFAPTLAAVDLADPDFAEAQRLGKDHDYEGAEKLYARLLKRHARDGKLHFDAGYNLYLRANTMDDVRAAAKVRKRSRVLMEKARKLGYDDALLAACLEAIAPDGTLLQTAPFSYHDAAEQAMQAAEKAFARGDMDGALAGYQEALQHDPNNYMATLYVGDVHFTRGELDEAADWFHRATRLNPNRETAHRYWGDVARQQKKYQEALWHYIDAVVAEPYNGLPRQMLAKYAQAAGLKWRGDPVKLPYTRVETRDGETRIVVTPDAGSLDLLYGLTCVQWRTDEFARHYGDESPRRSLREEMHALNVLHETTADLRQSDSAKLEPWKEGLAVLDAVIAADLLPPFVLLERVDADIARDYDAYRTVDRDGLRRYIAQFWCGLDLASPDGSEPVDAPATSN